LLTGSPAQVPTAITSDGTLGTTVTRNGMFYDITGGTRPKNGPNLFHSFHRFTVGTGDTARFSGPTGIKNILSRVTGGQQSLIDGRLQSTIPGANLYLLNPSGVLFGSGASLAISGSFHVSTADYLRFADETTFSAHLGTQGTLTVAAPAAFGFLTQHPGRIAIHGSSLRVPQGETLSIVGGDIEIAGGRTTPSDSSILRAPGGRIHISSVASPGEVRFSPLELAQAPQMDEFAHQGRLELSQDARLDVEGERGGSVLIHAGRLLVDRSLITASATGDGGNVELQVGTLTLSGRAQIRVDTRGEGRGGQLSVTATDTVTIIGAESGLFSNTGGSGDAGRVVISAPTLRMEGGLIQTLAARESRGNAGSLELQVGTLTLSGGAQIRVDTRGEGRGGQLSVTATDTVAIIGAESGLFTATTGSGTGGSIILQARDIQLANGARLSGRSTDDGNAGNIRLMATNTFLSENSAVTTEASQTDGGNILVTAQSLIRLRGSKISATVGGGPETVGGNITIDPEFVVMENSQIQANASEGRGGNIQITAGVFLADPTSQVSASSRLGIDGQVDIRAPVTNLSGVISPLPSGFASATALLYDHCAALLQEGRVSSFVKRGRDGVPAAPGGVLPGIPSNGQQGMADSGKKGGQPGETATSYMGQWQMDANGTPQIQSWPTRGFSQAATAWPCSSQ
jgi:filamentous hemagglutinin family protein